MLLCVVCVVQNAVCPITSDVDAMIALSSLGLLCAALRLVVYAAVLRCCSRVVRTAGCADVYIVVYAVV